MYTLRQCLAKCNEMFCDSSDDLIGVTEGETTGMLFISQFGMNLVGTLAPLYPM